MICCGKPMIQREYRGQTVIAKWLLCSVCGREEKREVIKL